MSGTGAATGEFRVAVAADAERIGEIGRAAYGHYERVIGVRPRPLDEDYAARVGEGVVWIADLAPGAEIEGFVILEPRADHLWIDNVAVDPASQHGGLGRAMLAFAERRAAKLGLRELRLLTSVRMERNIDLYLRLGYLADFERFEQGRQRVYMRKLLS